MAKIAKVKKKVAPKKVAKKTKKEAAIKLFYNKEIREISERLDVICRNNKEFKTGFVLSIIDHDSCRIVSDIKDVEHTALFQLANGLMKELF